MVDVGYNDGDHGNALATQFKLENWRSPRVVLAECGVTPEEVSHVFITHAHFDHMGGTDHFPNAHFYIQERELSKWVWAMSLEQKFSWLMLATDPDDVMRAVDLARQGRLTCVDGDRENVLPGIDLRIAVDTHTWGSMYVTVRNSSRSDPGDNWVLAGDLVYSFENLNGRDGGVSQYIPVGLAVGSQTNLIFTMDAMVKEVGGDTSRVIPIHEERLGEVYPSRITSTGLRVTEIALADGEKSMVG